MVLRSKAPIAVLVAALLLTVLPQGLWGGDARATGNPFVGIQWYADPGSAVARQATAWRGTRPGDAALLDLIAREQSVEWFGGWLDDNTLSSFVDRHVTQIAKAGGTPIMAVYNIPYRDCGKYSAGGANDPAHYRAWIARFARALGTRKAIIILEPDGLTVTECLSPALVQERYALIGEAVGTFKRSNPNVAVYIDGGDNKRNTVGEIVGILNAANIAQADGFFLNSTVYQYASTEVAYGREVGAALGEKHFVVDTSRNGLGPAGDIWCNAPGRALGVAPTTRTGEPLADAFIWLKPVWQSDGHCERGEPDAGQNHWDYALKLAQRSLQPFTDVPTLNPSGGNEEWVTAIQALTLRGVIRGSGDGTVGASSTTLRAQMAALIARPNYWERESAGNKFTDQGAVDRDLWRNVGVLANYKVAKGFGDGTFGPTDPVLYSQVILFISRAMVQKGYWQLQPDNATYFPNLLATTAQQQADRRDIATYVHYTQQAGGVPDRPATAAFVGWDRPAPRSWFAVALYRALLSAPGYLGK